MITKFTDICINTQYISLFAHNTEYMLFICFGVAVLIETSSKFIYFCLSLRTPISCKYLHNLHFIVKRPFPTVLKYFYKNLYKKIV